jgi:hypothetical protein
MRRVTDFAPIAAFTFIFLGAAADHASAQKLPTLRVVVDSATVRVRPALLSDVVAKAQEGTLLEALDLEDGWYWVVMARDENGTRYPGWIREHDVEIVAAGDPSAVLRHFSEAVEQAKAREEAEAAEQEARLEQAKERLDEARREYDAVAKRAANADGSTAGATGPAAGASAAPGGTSGPAAGATTMAPPVARQAGPARVPRSETPHASVSREYQWFAGYSFYRDQSDSLSFPAGWMLSGARHATPEIEIVGAISGSHRSDDALGVNVASTTIYTFSAGPKYARRTGSVTAFGQVLVGLGVVRSSTFGVSDSSAGFALQPGGGVDIPITKTLAFRIGGDVESVHASGGWFSGFRINAGVMLTTGGSK